METFFSFMFSSYDTFASRNKRRTSRRTACAWVSTHRYRMVPGGGFGNPTGRMVVTPNDLFQSGVGNGVLAMPQRSMFLSLFAAFGISRD